MAAQFSWAAAADVGLGVLGGLASWGTASANRKLAKANADAQNTIRKAQNMERASAVSLAGVMRAQGYRAALTNAGEQTNGMAEALARTQESWTRGNFEQGLRDMEQLGALTARASAAGVGGASVNAVSYSLRLSQARLAERQDERQEETQYELLKQMTGVMPATVSRLDVSPLSPNLDYSQNFTPASSGSGLLPALMEGLLSKGKSLQVALDSIQRDEPAAAPRGDYVPWEDNFPASTIQIN